MFNYMAYQTNPYEPLTSQNAALVLVDHQVGLMTGVRDYSTGFGTIENLPTCAFQK
jgi:hypothetical protein